MNQDLPGTSPYACVSLLVDDIADRIALAGHLAELDEIVRSMWCDHANGLLDEAAMEMLDEAARARRGAFQARQPRRDIGRERALAAKRAAKRAVRASTRSQRPCPPQLPREKLFGDGRPVPLDRNAKVRITTLARALMRPIEKGRHYGAITAKAFAVLLALLMGFHNAGTGRCFPSYETIAEAAGCHRDTVAEAIKMLEAAGILTWCNRRARIRIAGVTKVIRVSNSYRFIDPGSGPCQCPGSKSEFPSGTQNQELLSLEKGSGKESVPPPWGVPDGVEVTNHLTDQLQTLTEARR
jgi:hypothetical protein